jgi:protein gp37
MSLPGQQKDPANWWHYSVNAWWGCEKVSPACAFCYAEAFDKFVGRRMDPHGKLHWGKGAPRLFIAGFEANMLRKNAIFAANPQLGRPRVFADSMSDWLDPAVPIEWLWVLLRTIKACKSLDFLLVTKRPEKFKERLQLLHKEIPEARGSVDWWLGGGQPMNLWAGATVENADYQWRAAALLDIPAAIHFLSCEPLLGELTGLSLSGIDWVIIGGESGGKARPSSPVAIQCLFNQARAACIPVWFKQWGEWVGGVLDRELKIVELENGEWLRLETKASLRKLKDWGESRKEEHGIYDVISYRAGMNPREVKTCGEPITTDNSRYQGRIIRELPISKFHTAPHV